MQLVCAGFVSRSWQAQAGRDDPVQGKDHIGNLTRLDGLMDQRVDISFDDFQDVPRFS